jgi:hypothetical protein
MYTVRIQGKQRVFANLSDMEKFVRHISGILTYIKNSREWVHYEIHDNGTLTDADYARIEEESIQRCIADSVAEHGI